MLADKEYQNNVSFVKIKFSELVINHIFLIEIYNQPTIE